MKLQPKPLSRYHETPIQVRFNEVDLYRIAWHGHYVAWMEQARNDLAGRFGLDPVQIAAEGYLAPVVSLDVKYLRPARFADQLQVRTTLIRRETATIEFRCDIMGSEGKVLATGRTVHALTDLDGILQYVLPQSIAHRLEALFQHLGV
ncbi:MAG TPA: acyl-CoA thioesterase [Geomonas sp.]|nr:acyl-CoA thioesterase [Geomonas sp.]